MESDITTAVLASTGLRALIGDRFSWEFADGETVAPYIVAQTISGSGETPFDGAREVSFPLIQISCWAKTNTEAIAIMRQFKRDIEGVILPGDSKTSLGFTNQNSSHDSETNLFGQIYDYRASTTLT